MFEKKDYKMFSALISRNGKPAFWTPKFSGSEKKAQEYLATQKDAVECSLYRGQRFVKTVYRPGENHKDFPNGVYKGIK
jgi:hypothetical protein